MRGRTRPKKRRSTPTGTPIPTPRATPNATAVPLPPPRCLWMAMTVLAVLVRLQVSTPVHVSTPNWFRPHVSSTGGGGGAGGDVSVNHAVPCRAVQTL